MRDTADVLVLVVESWLRLQARAGHPPPAEDVRRALTAAALAAPRTAAACPELLRFTRVAQQVNALVTALDASEADANASGDAGSITAAQAAELLGIQPDSVRWLLRRGLLNGHRDETGWRVSAASVEAYKHGTSNHPRRGTNGGRHVAGAKARHVAATARRAG